MAQCFNEDPGTKLRSSIRMNDCTDGVSKAHSVAHGSDSKLGGHALTDGITDDSVGVNILDGAKIKFSSVGPMLRDVSEPQLVHSCRGEVAFHQIIMNRRPGFASQATLLRKDTPNTLLGAQPPYTSLRRGCARFSLDLIGNEPIPESRVIAVNIPGSIDEVSVIPIALRNRITTPLEKRLLRASPTPGRSPRPVFGQRLIQEPAGTSFWERRLG
jgi:hypothetical protein